VGRYIVSRPRIVFNQLIPPSPYNAMALGTLIIVRGRTVSEKTVAHELVHVDQYKRLGFARFLVTWAWEYVRKGYWNISLEQEAYKKQNDAEYLQRARRLLSETFGS